MIRKHVFKDKAKERSVRWRLHEPTRLEAFSDAVFAFALTLVVISLEVPETFDELMHLMKAFVGFAICFLFVVLIWHDQYVYFRRYGLQDTRTTFYNLALLFMVIYLVYPLKFLFYSFILGFASESAEGHARFKNDNQVCELMIIYSMGYFVIYSLLALMYVHALKKKKELLLSRLEQYNTRTYIYSFLARIGVVLVSLSLAYYGIDRNGVFALYAGLSYSLIGFAIMIVKRYRVKRIKHLFSEEEIAEVKNEIVVIEEG